MKKLILTSILGICFLSAYSQNDKRTITIGSVTDAAPYCYTDDKGNFDGYSVDIIKTIMSRLGYNYSFLEFDRESSQTQGNNELNETVLSRCDLSLIAVPSVAYKRHHYFSTPYSQINYLVISKAENPFSGLRDLTDKDIVVQKNSVSDRRMKALQGDYINNLIGVQTIPSGIKMLSEGVVDFMVVDDHTIESFRRTITGNSLQLSSSNFDPLNISFASNDGELIRNINRIMEDMKGDGTIDVLYKKWLEADQDQDYTHYFLIALLLLLIITAIALIFNFTLRRAVKRAEDRVFYTLNKNIELVYAINLLLKNSNTEILMFNEASHKLYILKNGVFEESDMDLSVIETMIHPDDIEQYRIDYNNIITSQVDYVVSNLRIYDPEISDYRSFEHTIIPAEKNESGVVTSYYYSRRDATETMKEVRQKERVISSFNLAMSSANIIRWRLDIKDRTVDLHYSDGRNLTSDPQFLLDNVAPKDVERLRTYILDSIEGTRQDDIIIKGIYGNHTEYRICKISSLIQVDKNGKPENIYGVINDITDITQSHQKQEELQLSLQSALDAGQMTAWRYNRDENSFISLYGPQISGGHMTMEQYMSYVHPEDKDIFPNALQRVLNGEIENAIVNFRLRTQSQGYRWYVCSLMSIKSDGKVKYVTGTRRDITNEMESRIELERSQSRLQILLDKIPSPVYIVDPECNKIVYCNAKTKSVLGFDIGSSSIQIYQEEFGVKVARKNEEILKSGQDYTATETIILNSGEVKNTFVTKTLVIYNNKPHILISRIDISEQEQMSRAQKLVNTSLPAFNAFTWSIDGRNHKLTYNSSGRSGFEDTLRVDSIDKCIEIIHPDDRKLYKEMLLDHIARGEGEFNMIYRSRNSEESSYEWWETRGIAEAIENAEGKHTILYGITINITPQKLTELSLKESKEKLTEINNQKALILNNTSSGMVYIDTEFKVKWSNFSNIAGFAPHADVYKVGETCHKGFGYEDTPCPNCPIMECRELTEQCTKEFDLGDIGVFEVTATPVSKDDKYVGAVLKIDNITERKKLINDLEQFNIQQNSYNQLLTTVIEKFPGILFIKDVNDDFKYLFASSEFCSKSARLSREQIIGHTDFDIYPNQELASGFRNDDIRVVNSPEGEVVEIGEERLNIDGVESIFQTTKLCVRLSNKRELIIGSAVDITDLTNINKNLVLARKKAEESERLKMAFLANMSHEIRTPLNAIVGFSELLQDAIDEDEKTEYINIINHNNELLLRLIGDILDLSKIESGTVDLKPETFDIVKVLDEDYSIWQKKNINPAIELIRESPYRSCILTLDKNRLLQVGHNFLSNAFKYTASGTITMGHIYENGGMKIYVKDTGIGIPQEKQHLAFERFAKLDDFAQGTGLGLPICQAIVDAYGGKIGFESEEGVGSTFWAWFPCDAKISDNDNTTQCAATDKGSERTISSCNGNGLNILIAEDNDSNYMLVRAILKNHNLTRAKNGAEAVEFATNQKYDAILMDVRMPVMDGLEATRQIRSFDQTTPIVAVTANAFDSDRTAAKEAGCNAFISKPLKKRELDEILGGGGKSLIIN